MSVHVIAFYRFIPLGAEQIAKLQANLEREAAALGVRGLCLLGSEGINSTMSGSQEALEKIKSVVRGGLGVEDIAFKESEASRHPFHYFRIKVKDEIVTIGKPGFVPERTKNFHLTPAEWDEAVKDPDTIVLDTRNDYEVAIGKFKSAVDFDIKEFRDFPQALAKAAFPKDKRVLMYCTGGIRCEKAILEMNAQGFDNVHQLEGGILNYLEQFPGREFDGECFVFDYRVAVDQKLEPTKNFKLCPHCGQPANMPITCAQCGTKTVICGECSEQKTCSKNCAHHFSIGSRSRRPHAQELRKRGF
ncbi:MAG TPA: rhodanese-like domain-containing protein [Bdellovibrionales bacterium]|nr:rhodanese-like domain-containing protein [Bdellovibrionales bacterium]